MPDNPVAADTKSLFTEIAGRVMGVVSRGGSMPARWMLENNRENPLLEYFDRLIEICLPNNVTLSLGDGLRPGAAVKMLQGTGRQHE